MVSMVLSGFSTSQNWVHQYDSELIGIENHFYLIERMYIFQYHLIQLNFA